MKNHRPSRVAQLFRLAFSDLRRDWVQTLCEVFGIAAVLTPLLILAGLHQGVLGRMLDELSRNVAMREIGPRVTGTNRFTDTWIETARQRPDVSFVIGDVLSLAAMVEADNPARPRNEPVGAMLLPSGEGDPLLQGIAEAMPAAPVPLLGGGRAVLSATLAETLGIGAGGAIEIVVPRTRSGTDESQVMVLKVVAVLPVDRVERSRRLILVDQPLALDVRDYRNGHAIPHLGWPGEAPPTTRAAFERFRLYARSIDDVEAVVSWLRASGVEPVSALDQIAPLKALDDSLSSILAIIAAFAALGFVVSVGATRWSGVQRRSRDLALLSLVGYGRVWLLSLPLVQGMVVALAGGLVAGGTFAAAANVVNARFPGTSEACVLSPIQLLAALGATVFLALLAAAGAALAAARLDAAKILRDG